MRKKNIISNDSTFPFTYIVYANGNVAYFEKLFFHLYGNNNIASNENMQFLFTEIIHG